MTTALCWQVRVEPIVVGPDAGRWYVEVRARRLLSKRRAVCVVEFDKVLDSEAACWGEVWRVKTEAR